VLCGVLLDNQPLTLKPRQRFARQGQCSSYAKGKRMAKISVSRAGWLPNGHRSGEDGGRETTAREFWWWGSLKGLGMLLPRSAGEWGRRLQQRRGTVDQGAHPPNRWRRGLGSWVWLRLVDKWKRVQA
jgi:hypothetical protein